MQVRAGSASLLGGAHILQKLLKCFAGRITHVQHGLLQDCLRTEAFLGWFPDPLRVWPCIPENVQIMPEPY